MLHTNNPIIKHKAGLLNLAEELGNVSKACKVMQSAYGEVIAIEAVFEEASGSDEIGKLSLMWQKAKSVLDGFVDTNKRIGAMQGMAEKG